MKIYQEVSKMSKAYALILPRPPRIESGDSVSGDSVSGASG
jgi:hypothetical protein